MLYEYSGQNANIYTGREQQTEPSTHIKTTTPSQQHLLLVAAAWALGPLPRLVSPCYSSSFKRVPSSSCVNAHVWFQSPILQSLLGQAARFIKGVADDMNMQSRCMGGVRPMKGVHILFLGSDRDGRFAPTIVMLRRGGVFQ